MTGHPPTPTRMAHAFHPFTIDARIALSFVEYVRLKLLSCMIHHMPSSLRPGFHSVS
ncbi:hypothetical protein BC826DRAFT_1031844 [Russula brevipes]|nr:hypothetical protein BC826DRAFT_1031844 [Russula brevipes]